MPSVEQAIENLLETYSTRQLAEMLAEEFCSDSKVAHLQSENEALRARVAELEDFAALAQAIGERQLDPDFVMPLVEADMKLLLKKAQEITKEDEAYDYENPWLLRKQAEAVEAVANRLKHFADTAHDDSECVAYRHGAEFATEEVNRLRQQADELEKAGGTHEA